MHANSPCWLQDAVVSQAEALSAVCMLRVNKKGLTQKPWSLHRNHGKPWGGPELWIKGNRKLPHRWPWTCLHFVWLEARAGVWVTYRDAARGVVKVVLQCRGQEDPATCSQRVRRSMTNLGLGRAVIAICWVCGWREGTLKQVTDVT